MLKKIVLSVLAILVAVVVLFVVVVAMQPADFRIVRTATMSAPPQGVFEQVNDFHNWTAWSPWEKLDPALKRTYEGPAEGKGAIYSWVGNEDVGAGRMTIEESKPGELVRIKLEFIEPFASTNTTEFTFVPEGDGTHVTWDMSGQNNFMSKAFDLLMDMDATVGADFEKGLAQMKAVVEAEDTDATSAGAAADEEADAVGDKEPDDEEVDGGSAPADGDQDQAAVETDEGAE